MAGIIQQGLDLQKTVFLTFDTDWAPDFIIDEASSVLIANKVKTTWFITHNSPAINRLRQYPELFELGIHPNFYLGSTHGKTEDEIMAHTKSIIPDAITMRTHGLYQNSNFLKRAVRDFGIKIDVSLFLPYTPNITPHYLPLENTITPLLRVPFFWEDDLELFNPECSWNSNDPKYNQPGLKIFNFHPIHIALNSYSLKQYNELKTKNSIINCKPDDIRLYKNHNEGTETLFLQIVSLLSGKGNFFKDLMEIT